MSNPVIVKTLSNDVRYLITLKIFSTSSFDSNLSSSSSIKTIFFSSKTLFKSILYSSFESLIVFEKGGFILILCSVKYFDNNEK